jgi:hypothetical protein
MQNHTSSFFVAGQATNHEQCDHAKRQQYISEIYMLLLIKLEWNALIDCMDIPGRFWTLF